MTSGGVRRVVDDSVDVGGAITDGCDRRVYLRPIKDVTGQFSDKIAGLFLLITVRIRLAAQTVWRGGHTPAAVFLGLHQKAFIVKRLELILTIVILADFWQSYVTLDF